MYREGCGGDLRPCVNDFGGCCKWCVLCAWVGCGGGWGAEEYRTYDTVRLKRTLKEEEKKKKREVGINDETTRRPSEYTWS